jgi:hypothetical protein
MAVSATGRKPVDPVEPRPENGIHQPRPFAPFETLRARVLIINCVARRLPIKPRYAPLRKRCVLQTLNSSSTLPILVLLRLATPTPVRFGIARRSFQCLEAILPTHLSKKLSKHFQ